MGWLVLIDIKEDLPVDQLNQFLSNLEAEPWFDCEVVAYKQIRAPKEL